MRVRIFEHGDEAHIAQIHNSAFKPWIELLWHDYYYDYITSQDVLSWLDTPNLENASLWVIEEFDNPIGYAHCNLQVESNDRRISTLYFVPTHQDMGQSKIVVLPKYQRKSAGALLVNSAIEHYKTLGAEVVIASTYSDNLPAENLLSSLGFSHPGIFYYPPFSENEPLGHDSVYARRDLTDSVPNMPLNSKVYIRPAEERDANALIELFHKSAFWIEEVVTHDWISDYFTRILNERGRIFIAELNGKLVGAMDYMKTNGRIGIPGILPEYRNQGVGYTLFYWLLKAMQNDGIRNAIVDTGIILSDAIRMYERFGFDIQRKQHMWFKVL